jgi:hypothetical protein
MWITSTAWGFWRSGESLGGSFFGPTPSKFGVGGTHDNPLLNDVEPGDEAAGVEFCVVFASQASSGVLRVRANGATSLTGATDGTYVIPESLFTFTPGDTSAEEAAGSPTTYTLNVGVEAYAGTAADLEAAATIAAATGTYDAPEAPAYTGAAADLAAAATLQAATGAYTEPAADSYIGTAADLAAAAILAAATGTYAAPIVYAGLAADLAAAAALSAGTGAYGEPSASTLTATAGFSAGLPGRRWTAVLDSKGIAR